MYEVRKGVPIPTPPSGRPANRRYPLSTMEVGDSFVVQFGEEEREKVEHRVRTAAYHASQNGKKFVTRKVYDDETGERIAIGVWRTE